MIPWSPAPSSLLSAAVDTLRDVRGLLVQEVQHVAGVPVELLLLVADVLDAVASDLADPAHVVLQLFLIAQADFAPYHDKPGRGEGFAGNARLRFFREKRIENSIGNAVADLVRG